jgi:hypothetical protein
MEEADPRLISDHTTALTYSKAEILFLLVQKEAFVEASDGCEVLPAGHHRRP